MSNAGDKEWINEGNNTYLYRKAASCARIPQNCIVTGANVTLTDLSNGNWNLKTDNSVNTKSAKSNSILRDNGGGYNTKTSLIKYALSIPAAAFTSVTTLTLEKMADTNISVIKIGVGSDPVDGSNFVVNYTTMLTEQRLKRSLQRSFTITRQM